MLWAFLIGWVAVDLWVMWCVYRVYGIAAYLSHPCLLLLAVAGGGLGSVAEGLRHSAQHQVSLRDAVAACAMERIGGTSGLEA